MNFPHIQWDCQNFAHILNYLISQPLISEYPPQQKPQSPTPGGNSRNIRLPCHTQKKYLSLSCSAPVARLFETIPVDTGQRGPEVTFVPPNVFGNQQTPQNLVCLLPVPKIDSIKLPNSTTFPNIGPSQSPNYRHAKVYAYSSDKPPMFELPDLGLKS